MQIEIEIQGLEKAKEIFKQLQNFINAEEQKDIMQTIGEITQNVIKESFENKKSPFGQDWEPLKKSTLKAKKGKGDILSFTGHLRREWHVEATSSKVEVYGNTTAKSYPYGAVHQFGTSTAGRNKSTKIPARPFLPIDKSGHIEPKLKDVIEKRLMNELRKRIE